jgi:hypothetical protein
MHAGKSARHSVQLWTEFQIPERIFPCSETGASTGTRKFHNGALNHQATCDSPSTRSSPHRSQHTAASTKYVFKSQGFSAGRARYFSPWLAPVAALIRFPVPFTVVVPTVRSTQVPRSRHAERTYCCSQGKQPFGDLLWMAC